MFIKEIRWYNRLFSKFKRKQVRKRSNKNFTYNLQNNNKVGIVLPVYNQERNYILECLQSIENQTYRNFKLVIVIDGANEETVNAVYEFSKILTCSFTIIHRKKNKGIAYSLNEGFEHLLDCPYLTWVSSDNRQKPHFLKKLVEAMTTAPSNTVLVYSMYQLIDENGKTNAFGQEWYTAMFNMMKRPKEDIMLLNFIGASFLFKRDAYESADGYDPTYPLVHDYEFWIKLRQLGEFKFIPNILVEYRLNGKHSLTTITPTEELYIESMTASVAHRRKNLDIPKVTVIITTHNHENYIRHCIESVLNQNYSNFHIVVLDIGSTDSTLEKIYSVNDARLIPVHLKQRHKAEALNMGLKYVLGDYVLELDGKDWIEPNTLQIFVNAMDNLPSNVGMIFANRQLWFERDGQLIEGPVLPGILTSNKYEVLENFQTYAPRMYRVSTLKKLKGWVSSLNEEPLLIDDYMMFLRIVEKFEIFWVNKTLYHQRRANNYLPIYVKETLNRQFRMVVNDTLQRWGNKFEAQYEETDGYITKITLKPR